MSGKLPLGIRNWLSRTSSKFKRVLPNEKRTWLNTRLLELGSLSSLLKKNEELCVRIFGLNPEKIAPPVTGISRESSVKLYRSVNDCCLPPIVKFLSILPEATMPRARAERVCVKVFGP